MNYVERHFGDWARDTAHLTMLEDGAYNRLCDLYYVREEPLPADLKACCRLVRAVSKPERDAVGSVLQEFFVLTEFGWTHRRCDAEIEKFRSKSSKASASAKARWDKDPAHSDGNANAYANASPDAMRTHSEGNATRGGGRTRSHSPNTSNQTPNPTPPPTDGAGVGQESFEGEGELPTPSQSMVREIADALRRGGLHPGSCHAGHPELLELRRQGATPEEFQAIAAEAVQRQIRNPAPWIAKTLAGRRADAQARSLAPKTAAPTPTFAGRFAANPKPAATPATETVDVEARLIR